MQERRVLTCRHVLNAWKSGPYIVPCASYMAPTWRYVQDLGLMHLHCKRETRRVSIDETRQWQLYTGLSQRLRNCMSVALNFRAGHRKNPLFRGFLLWLRYCNLWPVVTTLVGQLVEVRENIYKYVCVCKSHIFCIRLHLPSFDIVLFHFTSSDIILFHLASFVYIHQSRESTFFLSEYLLPNWETWHAIIFRSKACSP